VVAINRTERPFTFRLLELGSNLSIELMNESDQTLKCIEVLTVFLKDEETSGGGPSRAHIRFETLESITSRQRAILPHQTWINGKPANIDQDQLERLRNVEGMSNPYVLDVSWQDAEGKTRFQRIPVGH
jgi:hypothetical protein